MDALQNGNSRTRLAAYRKKAQECRADFEQGKNWRYWQHGIFATYRNVYGEHGQMFTQDVDQVGKYLGDAHKLAGRLINYAGWFADNFQSNTIIGGVARMRCSRGTLYIPVTRASGWDGTTHYLVDRELVPKGANEDEHDQAIRQACISADHEAQTMAEQAREDDAKDLAESDIDEARNSIHAINKKVLALLREIRSAAAFPPAICTALRDQVDSLLEQRKAVFETISERKSDYWSAVPNL